MVLESRRCRLGPAHQHIETFVPHDQFYLLSWARDLCFVFPFVDPRAAGHPYDVFSYLWKLSYIFGQAYSDASFALETLCTSPETELPRLMEAAGVRKYEGEPLRQLIVPQRGGKWVAFADNDWFCPSVRLGFVMGCFATPILSSLSWWTGGPVVPAVFFLVGL